MFEKTFRLFRSSREKSSFSYDNFACLRVNKPLSKVRFVELMMLCSSFLESQSGRHLLTKICSPSCSMIILSSKRAWLMEACLKIIFLDFASLLELDSVSNWIFTISTFYKSFKFQPMTAENYPIVGVRGGPPLLTIA